MITSHDRPRLREDLVAEAIEDRGVRFIDVIDPDNGNAYRFYDVEYSLACAMDGERDIPGLVRWAQEELGIAPSPKELQTVIATLGDLGYLDRADAAASAGASAAELGLAAGVRAGGAAPQSGIEVELGRFQSSPPAAAPPGAPVELELGAAGGSAASSLGDEVAPEVELGRAGAAPAQQLPVPTAAARAGALPRPRTNTPHQEMVELKPKPVRPSEQQVRAAAPARASEPAVRPSEPRARPAEPAAARRSEPRLRPSERQVAGPAAGQAGGPSDPSLNLSLPIRPDDVKEAVRASREMRSVDVPAELMQALEAAEQQPPRAPTAPPVASAAPVAAAPRPEARPEVLRSERPSAVTTAAVPSAAVLDPIAPISGAPASVSEPISPSSVPPLVPVPRTGARPEIRPSRPELLESRPAARAPSEPRGKASEPRIEYPRAVEGRPALTPAPREAPAAVATALPEPAPRRSNRWIVFVLVIAILGVVAVGVWKFVLEKKATPAPVTEAPVSTNPPSEAPVVPVAPVEPPSAKLSLVKGQPASVKMPVAGALQSVIEDGTVVKEGDELARLAGDKALVQSIAEAKGDLEKRYPFDIARLKKQLEAAPNNRAAQQKLAQREARVAQRTKDLAGYEAELAKLVITAPAAGKVAVAAKVGARLPVEAEVATIEQEPYLSGAATMNEKVEKAAGDAITVKVKGATATAQCTLETVQDDKISFRCPVADGFADGADVLVEAK